MRRMFNMRWFRWLALSLMLLPAGCDTAQDMPTLPQPESPLAKPTSVPTSDAESLPSAAPTATPTPTPVPGGAAVPATDTPPPANLCRGLTADLEVRILAGPAEAVGLEPFAIGQVPIAVTSEKPLYLVSGGGPIAYSATLAQEWGTYQVTMDLDLSVNGECLPSPGAEQLNLVVDLAGDQLVKVEGGSFQGEYPWSGSASQHAILAVEDGATAEGEGWMLVLHLPAP